MAFDVQALRQLSDMPLPSDPVELARVWRHVGLDLCAAADEIERLRKGLEKVLTADPTSSIASDQGHRWWVNVTDLIKGVLAGREVSP